MSLHESEVPRSQLPRHCPRQGRCPALAHGSCFCVAQKNPASSAWEIAIKTRMGRLEGTGILSGWAQTLNAMAASELVMDSADATLAGQLNWDHRDPFDRMIVAQATRRGLAIATSDRVIREGAMTPVIVTG